MQNSCWHRPANACFLLPPDPPSANGHCLPGGPTSRMPPSSAVPGTAEEGVKQALRDLYSSRQQVPSHALAEQLVVPSDCTQRGARGATPGLAHAPLVAPAQLLAAESQLAHLGRDPGPRGAVQWASHAAACRKGRGHCASVGNAGPRERDVRLGDPRGPFLSSAHALYQLQPPAIPVLDPPSSAAASV